MSDVSGPMGYELIVGVRQVPGRYPSNPSMAVIFRLLLGRCGSARHFTYIRNRAIISTCFSKQMVITSKQILI